MRPRTIPTYCIAGALTLLAPAAHAISFDADGHGTLDPTAVFTDDFETADERPDAVTGTHVGVFTHEKMYTASISLGGASRAHARVFARGATTAFVVSLPPSGDRSRLFAVGLFPTGRVTSDGWMELESTDADFDPNATTYLRAYATQPGASIELDAVEVFATQAAAPAMCDAASACSADHMCLAGRCVAEGAGVPALPAETDRIAVADLFVAQLQYHGSGVATRRAHLADALAELEAMKTETSSGHYWRRLHAALHALHDTHAFMGEGPLLSASVGACFVEGIADVSGTPTGRPDVLVSHALVGSGFHAGDHLIAVDGKHPIDFIDTVAGRQPGALYGNDPRSHSAAAAVLENAIARFATTITVASCSSAGACSPPVQQAVATLPNPASALHCDNRILLPTTGDTPDPASHMMDKDVYFTPLRNTESAAGFYATLFNSFELSGPDDPFAPFVPTMKSAAGVLFDHRAGEGGLQYLAQELTTPFLPPAKRVTQIAPQAYVWNDQFDAATGKTLFDWAEDEASGRNSGAADFDPARRAALLIVNGGSTGDFFPFLMKGPKNVRVFGSSTRGGFSTAQYFTFGSMSWGFGAGDSLRPDGTTLLGTGVDPDEVVLPRQSDVLRGIDTALARAREWLTTCTDCTGDMP